MSLSDGATAIDVLHIYSKRSSTVEIQIHGQQLQLQVQIIPLQLLMQITLERDCLDNDTVTNGSTGVNEDAIMKVNDSHR